MEHNGMYEEKELDLKEIMLVLLRRSWIIIISGIILALIAFSISKYVLVPVYTSTTKIYVMNKQDASSSITYSDLQTGRQLTNDYKALVISRPVTEKVVSDLGLNISSQNLISMISVTNLVNTRILTISVEYTDPKMAKAIADAVREAAAEQIRNVMNIDQVNVVEYANLPEEPSGPNKFLYTVVGGMLGVMLSAFVIIAIHILDDRIKTSDDIEKHLGISVLSSIPSQRSSRRNKNELKSNNENEDKVISTKMNEKVKSYNKKVSGRKRA